MDKGYTITIARQYGCGGRAVGRKLAERLGINYYDNELITRAAERNGVDEAFYKGVDEKARGKFSSLFAYGTQGGSYFLPLYSDLVVNDQLFYTQANIIKEVAAESPSVIVGRCADYVLRDRPNLVKVFLHADLDARKDRIVNRYGVEEKNLDKLIAKADKRRATYYNTYTDQEWGNYKLYDIAINTSKLSIEQVVDLIVDYIDKIDKN